MRITRIETFLVGHGWNNLLFTRLHTDTGLSGVGEGTMQWQANLLTPAPRTREGWWLLRSTGDYAEQGCSSQRMAIWSADGEPMMAGMQSVAVFG